MKRCSFWEIQAFGDAADLLVIGAGIVGLSSALFYKQQHPQADVMVVDKGSIPEGASTRNAGFACVGSITEHVADMEKESEVNIKKRIRRRYEGLHLLRKTLGDEVIQYENCGGYELFTKQKKFDQARRLIPQFNKWLDELVEEPAVYEAQKLNGCNVIYNRLEGALHPGLMMQALIEKVRSFGIEIHWNTRVRQIDKSGTVRTGQGRRWQARQVLVATNGFTKRLLPDVSIEPARGMVMVSEPWPEMPWRGTFHYDRGYMYFRHIGDRLLLGGGRNTAEEQENKDQFGVNGDIKNFLNTFARETLNIPSSVSFEREWSGIMGFTPTKTPVLQRRDDHTVVAAGLSGMGIAIGMDVGQTTAQLLAEIQH